MSNNLNQALTPEQTAELLQVSKNTVYDLIERGEIMAKKYGRVYRIPIASLSFLATGLDFDLMQKEAVDNKDLSTVHSYLKKQRKKMYEKG